MIMHVLVRKVDRAFKLYDSDIVVKVAWIVFRMNNNRDNVFLDVRVEFRFAVDIPFTQTHSQVTRSVSALSNDEVRHVQSQTN